MTLLTENATTRPTKLEQKKYVVAFLDFLGASKNKYSNLTN